MIDIHTHILPDFDDGAKNIDETLHLCAMGRGNHIKATVATPHFNALGDIDNFLELRDKKVNLVKKALEDNKIDMQLFAGAEVFIDDDIFFSRNLSRLTINKSRYILIEFAFTGLKVRDIHQYLQEICNMGIVPIIAHPERYEYFQRDYDAVNELISRGALFQINAGSLASRDGREEFELAYEMAFKGAASFIATDAHSPYGRANDFGKLLREFPDDINPKLMEKMLFLNPKAVLNDNDLPNVDNIRIEKRRFY